MAYYDPGTAQFGFVTRRRPRPNRVAMINEQAAMLPQLKELQGTQDYMDKMYDLESKGLESDIAYKNRMAGIARKSSKEARNIGYANLGLSTVMGAAQYGQSSPSTGDSPGVFGSAWQGVKRVGSEAWGGLTDIYDWAGGLFA